MRAKGQQDRAARKEAMRYEAPWTGLGAVQQEIDALKSDMHGKASSYGLDEAKRRLDSLEHSLRQISADVAAIQYRLAEIEASQLAHSEEA